jgi:carotenoid cleavage dioxygenase
MVDFSEGPHPGGFAAPMRFEAEILECEVEGAIPPELDGIFVRTGPDWFYPQIYPNDTPFSADGYVSTFRIKNGKVGYRGKYVRTPRFINNLEAGRQLYGVYRNPFTDDPSIREQTMERPWERTVANTTPLAHAGKLFALKEDAPPIEIDPNTLETKGFYDFGGRYTSQTFTAHPKPDPRTGELVTFGYEATGLCTDDVWIYTIDRTGAVTHEIKVKVPFVSMIHDLIVTETHVLIPVFGYVTSMERLRAGEAHWGYDPASPATYGVLRRDGDGSDIQWFDAPAPMTMVHTLNGVTIGDKIVMDSPQFDGNPFPFFPAVDGSDWRPNQSHLRRFTFDLNSGRMEQEQLFEPGVSDLVRVDDRYLTQQHRYCYTQFNDPAKPEAGTAYLRFDVHSRETAAWHAGEGQSLMEVSFIPRSANAPEGDGWLIGVANNTPAMRSDLVIVDAVEMQEVARVILPFRSSAQVHARWFAAAELPGLV